MGDADEDVGGDDDVENGVVGDEDQDAVRVRRQPAMVLCDKQLKHTREK